jgi:hypothetical protein
MSYIVRLRGSPVVAGVAAVMLLIVGILVM